MAPLTPHLFQFLVALTFFSPHLTRARLLWSLTLSLHADKCKKDFPFKLFFLAQLVPWIRSFDLCVCLRQSGWNWATRYQGVVPELRNKSLTFVLPQSQAEKVLQFSQETNLTALLLEAKELEARVIILSAR